jgi:hypothetical protein
VFFDDYAKDVRGGGERENQEYRAVLLGEGGGGGGVSVVVRCCVCPGTESASLAVVAAYLLTS